MTCPHNQFGQPACFIVTHPDHPNESFCVTCGKKFYTTNRPDSSATVSADQNHEIIILLIVVLMLMLLFKATFSQSQLNCSAI